MTELPLWISFDIPISDINLYRRIYRIISIEFNMITNIQFKKSKYNLYYLDLYNISA